MAEEETKEVQEEKEEKRLSLVEETKILRDDLLKIRDEIRQENERKERLLSNEILSGTSGSPITEKQQIPKEESARDYMNKVMSGGLNGTTSEE